MGWTYFTATTLSREVHMVHFEIPAPLLHRARHRRRESDRWHVGLSMAMVLGVSLALWWVIIALSRAVLASPVSY
jgi:hypothetical protein